MKSTCRKFFMLFSLFIVIGVSHIMSQAIVEEDEDNSKTPVVILFIIDGLMPDAAQVAMNNGAENLKYFKNNGVVVDKAYCLSPAGSVVLPDESKPWGGATPPNIGMHTGTHVFEIPEIDDIFLAARRNGLKSVFAGGHDLYQVFQTPDFTYAKTGYSDSLIVQLAINHIKQKEVKLYRLHLQQIRYSWDGPAGMLDPYSEYQKGIQNADKALGRLVQALKDNGQWENSYLIITSDHGMGQGKVSRHYATDISSWKIYMNFYGPQIKKGAHIPYAESPDLAIMVNHLLGSPQLLGYTKECSIINNKKTTGTLLENVFEGNGNDVDHPMWVKKYLESTNWQPEKSYFHFRQAMLDNLQ